jgi:hypothetical protein
MYPCASSLWSGCSRSRSEPGRSSGRARSATPSAASCPTSPCEKGTLCKLDPGSQAGTCAEECNRATAGTLTACPDERPICGGDGTCRACAADAECQERGTSLSRCVDKKCAACRDSSDCGDPLKPVCDPTSRTCRPCALHSECTDHVCVKDDTLAGLTDAAPLQLGQCVPLMRQVVLDRGCTGCTLTAKLAELSPEKPYLRVSGLLNLNGTANKPLNGLPVLHLVTDAADLSPAQLATAPTTTLSNGALPALQINAGVHAVLEGLVINNSSKGLVCTGTVGAPGSTQVRVLRSLLASNGTAIISQSCDLRIEDSWIGFWQPASGGVTLKGNGLAMDLDTTRFEILNTVLVRNAPEFFGTGFSGLRIRNTQGAPQPGRILHSTFARQDTTVVGGNVLAVDCTYNVAGALTILNSLFLNDAQLGANTYVAPNCRSTHVAYNGSNDPALAGTGSVTNLTYGEVFATAPDTNNPRLKASALPSLQRGTASYVDALNTPVDLPARDIEGKPRSTSNPVYGAFETAFP